MATRRFLDLGTRRLSDRFVGGNAGPSAGMDFTLGSSDGVTLHFVEDGDYVRLGTGYNIELAAVENGTREPSNYVIQTDGGSGTWAESDDSTDFGLSSGSVYGYDATPDTDTAQARTLLGIDAAGITSDDRAFVHLTAQLEIVRETGASAEYSLPFRVTVHAPVISSTPSAPGA